MTNQTTTETTYTHDELLDALLYVHDIFERSIIPFVLLKNTARSVVEGTELSGPIHIGIKNTDYISSSMQILDLLADAEETTNKHFLLHHNNVPIYVHIIKKHYEEINNPDIRNYANETWYIPNNFESYWNIRHSYQ